jgi:DNA-binding Lrp family transcriptional regulator
VTTLSLTERDRTILLALLHKVPVLSVSALSELWPDTDSGRDNLARRVWQLEDAGLVRRYSLSVQSAPTVSLFYDWSPGKPEPDLGAAAWALSKRWAALEPRRVAFVTATATAATRYGVTIRNPLRSTSAVAHNVGLGMVYMHYLMHEPLLASAWVAEEVIAAARGHGEKVVDACIVDSTSTPALAVEFAGASYAASNGERLRDIHHDCSERGLPYEMWTVPEGGAA